MGRGGDGLVFIGEKREERELKRQSQQRDLTDFGVGVAAPSFANAMAITFFYLRGAPPSSHYSFANQMGATYILISTHYTLNCSNFMIYIYIFNCMYIYIKECYCILKILIYKYIYLV